MKKINFLINEEKKLWNQKMVIIKNMINWEIKYGQMKMVCKFNKIKMEKWSDMIKQAIYQIKKNSEKKKRMNLNN